MWYNGVSKIKPAKRRGVLNYQIFQAELKSHHGTLLNRFNNMRARCYNKRSRGFKYYGGKGITICEEWLDDPDSFVWWALLNGYFPKSDIHRVNNHKGYSPDNCIFLDPSVHSKFHAEMRREMAKNRE